MRIKKIILENIRSYKLEEINFPKGSVLLSGNIGSGKTSILLGIEFALFGLQPGQKGSSLLRNGKDEGKVILEFEIQDKEIIIERRLKRNKSVSQSYCSISINNEKRELSVTELKNKVLELLNYPKEFSKKQNILYRFTVYTPQEEMKQIILEDSETRINTLRHVFGIDKYKRIIENSSIVIAKIREEKRIKQALTSDIEKDKEELLNKKNELAKKEEELIAAKKELEIKQTKREEIQKELSEISKKIEEKNKIIQEIEKTKVMISAKKDTMAHNSKLIKDLQSQIEELEKIKFDPLELEEIKTTINSFKQEKELLNKKIIEISSEINALNFKIKDNNNIKSKLTYIEVCPTCLQDVNQTYKNNVLKKLESNNLENEKNINLLNSEKEKILLKISELDKKINQSENKISELNIIKLNIERISEKNKNIEETIKMNSLLEQDLELLEKHLIDLKKSNLEMQKFDNLSEIIKSKFDEASKEEKLAEIKIAELKKEIEFSIYQIKNLEEKIKKTKEIEKQLVYLSNLENWISKNFIPLIYLIERNVMTKLKSEFSKLFGEWFCMLVSDTFNTRLREDFTPIIEQQDYEIDYAYLSGGERTAVALAYRLALNQVINSLLSNLRTKDLVILDEPTEGFSEQQLDKMRDVLEQLNIGQLIIVSHEQKIESFVDNVIRLKKENGLTKIV